MTEEIKEGMSITEESFFSLSPKKQSWEIYRTVNNLIERVGVIEKRETHVCPYGKIIEKKVDAKNRKKKIWDNVWAFVGGIVGGVGYTAGSKYFQR